MRLADKNRWTTRTLTFLVALLLFRCSYLAIMPLELCADEAYYWDWSRQLDWGYYSKPPMIAWLIAAATSVGGDSEFVIRLPAAVLATVGLWPVYLLGSRMFSPRAGFWSVLAVAATPGMAAMAMLMTIDAPFLCCWAWTLWLTWELLSPETTSWTRVWPAILATGLGLLSKQTMLAIIPLSALWLLVQPQERRKLLSVQVWTWWLGSLACLTPVAYWNWQHHWITLQHTGEHFQSGSATLVRRLLWFLEFWATQLGILTPITCALLIFVACFGLRTWHRQDRRVHFLLCFGAIPMVGVSMLAWTRQVQPNWPAAFVLPSFLLLAGWADGALAGIWPERQQELWFRRAISWGAVLTIAVMAVPLLLPLSPLAGSPLDPTARLRGWRMIGAQVADTQTASSRTAYSRFSDSPTAPPLLIAATGRGPVSLLGYYVAGQPRVYRWNLSGTVDSQHEIWGGPAPAQFGGRPAILITPAGSAVPAELGEAFESIAPIRECATHLGGDRWERLQLWQANGYRYWPVARRSGTGAGLAPESGPGPGSGANGQHKAKIAENAENSVSIR